MSDAAAPDAGPPAGIGTATASVDTSIDARTGEPRRPWLVTLASGLLLGGIVPVVAGLLWAFWRSIREFEDAAWLNGVVATEPGSLLRVLMVVALFTVTLLIGAASIIAGHYAWRGFGWTRWAGVIAAATSLLALLINWVAWIGIPLVAIGAALLWTPPARRFFEQWHLRRHPVPPVVEPATHVHYGPLERYR
ncbi:MAG: hypothetical protein Q4F65_08835 [Propionibacteriaceae bacterium]|nr:hypothetical protein [Propionibacteriaceae bacterium]